MLEANYFDGKSSRRHAATLRVHSGQLTLAGEWGVRSFALAEVKISEPLGNAPRAIRFSDGAYCEVTDLPGFAALLKTLGHRDSVAVRMHKRWLWVLGALLGVAGAVLASYVWVLPWGAALLAPKVPQAVVEHLSVSTLEVLDQHMMSPSKLSPERTQALRDKMAAFAAQGQLPPYKLHFRYVEDMPPNAFALPNGDIVIFDSLLDGVSEDEAIAVFGHELGHVAHHHGLRMLMQSAVVSTVIGLYLGDLSSVVAVLATTTLEANYSQAFESEADMFSAAALKRAGMSPMLLASALQKIEAVVDCKGPPENKNKEESWFERTFSSHPSTAKRAAALQALQ